MIHLAEHSYPTRPTTKPSWVRLGLALILAIMAAPALGQTPATAIPYYQPAPNVTRFAAPSAALADTNGSGVPVVSNPQTPGRPPIYSGASMSPDGKILFTTASSEAVPGFPGHFLQHKGLFVTHVQHDQITVDPQTGEPDLGSGVDTPLTLIDLASCSSVECPDRQGSVFLTVIDDPALSDTRTNPYRADCGTGDPNLAGACQGYDFQLIMNGSAIADATAEFEWTVPLANGTTGKPALPAVGASDLTHGNFPDRRNIVIFLQRRLRLTVDLLATPRIVGWNWLDGGSVPTLSFDAGDGNHFPLSGLEPTLSFDGHLLVWQGNPAQVEPDDLGQTGGRCFSYWEPAHGVVPRSPCATGYWRGPPQGHGPCCDPQCSCAGDNPMPQQYACLPGAPTGCTNRFPYLTQNVMMYAYRDDPNDAHGWTVPRSLTELHGDYFGVPLAHYNGRSFQEIYPIARQPMLDGAGTLLDKINGNYCWLTLDATDVIWNANAHARTSIIGASTGFHMQHIDGPVNPTTYLTGSHESDDRETFVGWGPTPGLWGPIDVGKRALPYLQGSDRKIALYGHEVNNYVEVRLFAERPDRLLRLGMNKALRENTSQPVDVPVSFTPQTDATDDFSGNGQTGLLVGGAQFPPNHEGFNGPKSGESIQITGAGHVAVANPPQLASDFDAGLSAGLFVRVDSAGRRYLLNKSGSFRLHLRNDGRVAATVTMTTGNAITAISDQTLTGSALGAWHHVAFTYDGSTLRLYFDGNQVGTRGLVGTVAGTTATLEVGREVGTTAADVTVDDLEVWGTAWTPTEVAELAYIKPPPSIFRDNPTLPGLPSGLDGTAQAFLKIPIGSLHDLTTHRVGLGRDLFNDVNLSHASLNMACATCHQAGVSFAEGSDNGFSRGSAGTLLPRQTPPVFNRAFAGAQLWDARADLLETQASQPILDPTEMNNTPAVVEAYIQANYANGTQTGNRRNFRDAYGVTVPVLSDLELALAAYQRAIVSGGSVVDDYADGTPIPGVNADAILRGRKLFFNKARCATCHQGPNFSDNALHQTVAVTTDAGAGAFTGRAEHQGAFKTPSLRQLLDTPDYFHNGSEGTLPDLVDLYETGGTSSDPEIRPLGLTAAERADLVQFLEALQSGVIELF